LQVRELRAAFNKHPLLENIRVSTVDAFQGAENDVIVVVTSQVAPPTTHIVVLF
jgi:superfamily I DNA and/or RNA helicase